MPDGASGSQECPGAAEPLSPRVVRLAADQPRLALLLLATFAAYFGILLAAVFEIFRQLDRLLASPWSGRWVVVRAAVVLLLGLLAFRVAWRLSLSILGLLTRKYDAWGEEQTTTLPRDGQLGQVVDEVCRRIDAPRPDEVRLAAGGECFVVEERQFSLSTRRRLLLVLGMPQMLVMTVGEVEVILAHELAHFRSGDTTLTVFLFRLAESARLSAVELGRFRLWWLDPVYWYFAVFQRLFVWASAPWRRNHELQADAVSAAAFGGEHAAQTLLKEWLVEGRFESLREELHSPATSADARRTLYRQFLEQWTDYSPATHDYLERRLLESERVSLLDPQPTMGQRLKHLRRFPDVVPVDTRPASQLLPAELLPQLEHDLQQSLADADGQQ